MDTRELKYETGTTRTIRDAKTNHWLGTMDSWDGAVKDELDTIGGEIAHRWNTHPELLSALVDLCENLEAMSGCTDLGNYDFHEDTKEARAIIAKAKRQ